MPPRNLHHQRGHLSRAAGMTLVETLVTFVILGFLTTLILQAVGFFAARYEGVQRVHRVAALESLQQNWFATSVQGFVPYGVHARRFQGQPTRFEGMTLEPLHAQAGTPVTVRWSIAEDGVLYSESLAPSVPGIEWPIRGSDTSVRPQSRPQADTREIFDIDLRSRRLAPGYPDARQGDLVFHYADAFANWYDHWPPRPDADPVPGTAPRPGQAAPQSIDDLIDALAETATVRVSSDDPLLDPANDWTPRLIRLFSAEEGTIWLARVEPSARPLLTDVDVE